MRKQLLTLCIAIATVGPAGAQDVPSGHPDTGEAGWTDLFAPDLSDARYPQGVWTVEDGVLTASEDEAIWSAEAYDDFILDLEFKNAPGTNSGVIVYASDLENWIPNSIEIQIADDFAEQWANAPASWRNGAFFGHKGATEQAVRPAGEWNRYTITARGPLLRVVLNGRLVNEMDLRQWTSAEVNPDGTEIPEWLSKPKASLPTRGHIGLQGKHAGAPVWFRNIRVKRLE